VEGEEEGGDVGLLLFAPVRLVEVLERGVGEGALQEAGHHFGDEARRLRRRLLHRVHAAHFRLHLRAPRSLSLRVPASAKVKAPQLIRFRSQKIKRCQKNNVTRPAMNGKKGHEKRGPRVIICCINILMLLGAPFSLLADAQFQIKAALSSPQRQQASNENCRSALLQLKERSSFNFKSLKHQTFIKQSQSAAQIYSCLGYIFE